MVERKFPWRLAYRLGNRRWPQSFETLSSRAAHWFRIQYQVKRFFESNDKLHVSSSPKRGHLSAALLLPRMWSGARHRRCPTATRPSARWEPRASRAPRTSRNAAKREPILPVGTHNQLYRFQPPTSQAERLGKHPQGGSCHKRQKPQAPTPQAPIRNRQTRKVANAKDLNRSTNLT